MILYVDVCLQQLASLGKKFKWEKPSYCLRCGRKNIWGHGYVGVNFEGFSNPLWIKRWRCTSCKTILITRPRGFFSRFQNSTKRIYNTLYLKIKGLSWKESSISRQRGRHWLIRFIAFIRMHYGFSLNNLNLGAKLSELYHKGIKFLETIK